MPNAAPTCTQVGGGRQRRPALLLTEHEPMTDVMAAYHEFDLREPGGVKVALNPAA